MYRKPRWRARAARLEGLLAVRERALEVERTDDAVLGGAERQVHDRNGHLPGLRRLHADRRRHLAAVLADRRASGSQP
jgi:hypothetical protein